MFTSFPPPGDPEDLVKCHESPLVPGLGSTAEFSWQERTVNKNHFKLRKRSLVTCVFWILYGNCYLFSILGDLRGPGLRAPQEIARAGGCIPP